MALPQKVLERLSREPPETPGWSFGLLMFTGGILFIMLLIYFGLAFGYEPYLNGQIADLTTQINTTAKSVSASDQDRLITFYSQIVNIKKALASHVMMSHLLTWLENDTEANVYYTRFTLSTGNRISLQANAAAEADVNQQIAIFEAAPAVESVTPSAVTLSPQTGEWQFAITLVMKTLSPTTTAP